MGNQSRWRETELKSFLKLTLCHILLVLEGLGKYILVSKKISFPEFDPSECSRIDDLVLNLPKLSNIV